MTLPNAVDRFSRSDTTDPLRGPYNDGGPYGERKGWHLGRGGDAGWLASSLPSADGKAGVTWYRTTATLDLPRGGDRSLGLTIADPPESPLSRDAVRQWLAVRQLGI